MDSAMQTVTGLPWNGVDYFCTTRQGGVSTGSWSSINLGLHTDDDSAAVAANRQRMRNMLPGAPVWMRQVHGTDVFDADEQSPMPAGAGTAAVPVADAAITTMAGRVLAIMTADCLPVVLASTDGTVLGLAHAGWRGLAGGML